MILKARDTVRNKKNVCQARTWSHLRHSLYCVAIGLEAFAVDNGRSALVVLLLADPHLLEGGQGG
jgi:hypothetical protein